MMNEATCCPKTAATPLLTGALECVERTDTIIRVSKRILSDLAFTGLVDEKVSEKESAPQDMETMLIAIRDNTATIEAILSRILEKLEG